MKKRGKWSKDTDDISNLKPTSEQQSTHFFPPLSSFFFSNYILDKYRLTNGADVQSCTAKRRWQNVKKFNALISFISWRVDNLRRSRPSVHLQTLPPVSHSLLHKGSGSKAVVFFKLTFRLSCRGSRRFAPRWCWSGCCSRCCRKDRKKITKNTHAACCRSANVACRQND